MEEDLIQKAFVYLTDKTYPEGSTKNEKRCIRKKAEKIVVLNGVLHYKKKCGAQVCITLFFIYNNMLLLCPGRCDLF